MAYTEVASGAVINASTINDIIRATLNRPTGRLVASGAQALADNTQVAILFSTEAFDSANFHSTSSDTSRVTPSKAGQYRFSATGFFESQASPVFSDVNFRFNGTTHLAPAERVGVPPAGSAFSLACTVLIEMNGTTDYIELMMRQDSGGADNTNQSVQYSSVLEWEYVRELT